MGLLYIFQIPVPVIDEIYFQLVADPKCYQECNEPMQKSVSSTEVPENHIQCGNVAVAVAVALVDDDDVVVVQLLFVVPLAGWPEGCYEISVFRPPVLS